MKHTELSLLKDIDRIRQLSIVPTILDVICQSTGMGFAAIARVTHDRWIACSVRDDIAFGLVPGGELRVETTICDEIRDSHTAVIIDHVDESDEFRHHHTPLMYGFQSYISFPIVLKNGDLFGTLCAIDPRPAQLNNKKTIDLFNLFTELIAFHLQNEDLIDQSNLTIQNLSRKLIDSVDENRQYRHISNHNLQEPLRKIRILGDMIVEASDKNDVDQVKDLALKINSNAQKFSMMIKDLSNFSELDYNQTAFENVCLNQIIADVSKHLDTEIKAKNVVIEADDLPSVHGISTQIEQLFYHLISNAIKFSRKDIAPVIKLYTKNFLPQDELKFPFPDHTQYVEIFLEDNGIGIDQSQIEKIFDIFTQLPSDQIPKSGGVGLSYCRKIVRNHGGNISAQSELDNGTIFSIILPAV